MSVIAGIPACFRAARYAYSDLKLILRLNHCAQGTVLYPRMFAALRLSRWEMRGRPISLTLPQKQVVLP
jgi:transposase